MAGKRYTKYLIGSSLLTALGYLYFSSQKPSIIVTPPDWLDKYLLDNNLQKSVRYEQYRKVAKDRGTFFDTAILSEMNAFNHFGFYRKKQSPHTYCIFSSKDKLSFHRQIMHGGATATLIDTSFALQAAVLLTSLVATAKLEIIYKRPLFTNEFYIMQLKNLSDGSNPKRLSLEANIRKLVQQNQDLQKVLVLATAEMVAVEWDDTKQGDKSLTAIMENILKKPKQK